MKPLAAILGPQSEVGQTQLVKKVPSGQHFIFFDLRVWSKKVFGSRTRTRVFSTLEFSFFAGAGEYLLTSRSELTAAAPSGAADVYRFVSVPHTDSCQWSGSNNPSCALTSHPSLSTHSSANFPSTM